MQQIRPYKNETLNSFIDRFINETISVEQFPDERERKEYLKQVWKYEVIRNKKFNETIEK
jgi:hypothetical protein